MTAVNKTNSSFLLIFFYSRPLKQEDCSLSAEDTSSPQYMASESPQGPPTPPTTPNRGPVPRTRHLVTPLSCSQPGGKSRHFLTYLVNCVCVSVCLMLRFSFLYKNNEIG